MHKDFSMRIKNGFELRKVGDEFVVITVGDAINYFNGMIKLNCSGKFIWENLHDGIELDDLTDKFAATFSIDKTIAAKDVNEFIKSLKQTNCFED